ncbi:HNH endonuclease [Amycolatopsis sp. NPDC049159]|uniref:HNH endonuclease n=1 Tax=Amycolatopsis sp. NPDC049159 TaxID=3157210 RepID=UPI0033E4A145
MRRIAKSEKPGVLSEKAEQWTAEYKAATEKKPTPWKHEEIRAALRSETDSRCAYCESEINSVTYDQIEHILPKSRFPDLVVDWNNLTLVCPRCNNLKRDYYDPGEGLVNPYVDRPSDHIVFLGSWIWPRPGNGRGKKTVDILGLCRAELVQRRQRRLEWMMSLVEQWKAADGEYRERIQEIINDDFEAGEYQAMVEAFLGEWGFPLRQKSGEYSASA